MFYPADKALLDNFEATASSFHPHKHFRPFCESRTLKLSRSEKTFFASLKGILSFEELLWTSTYSEQLLLISKRCHPQISFFEGISWSFFVLSDILVVLYRLRWRTIDVIDHVLSFDYPSIYNYLPTHLYIFSKCSSRAAIDCFNS